MFEWPISFCFTPVKQVVRQDKTLVLIMIASEQLGILSEAALAAKGRGYIYRRVHGTADAAAAERLHVEAIRN